MQCLNGWHRVQVDFDQNKVVASKKKSKIQSLMVAWYAQDQSISVRTHKTICLVYNVSENKFHVLSDLANFVDHRIPSIGRAIYLTVSRDKLFWSKYCNQCCWLLLFILSIPYRTYCRFGFFGKSLSKNGQYYLIMPDWIHSNIR